MNDSVTPSPNSHRTTSNLGFEEKKNNLHPILTENPCTDVCPDGGPRAWFNVLGGFCLFVNCWGIMNTWGAFQTHYKVNQLSDYSNSAIAWIGSFQPFLCFIIGPVAGRYSDQGHFKALVTFGMIIGVFSIIIISFCKEYYQFLLVHGILLGVSEGLIFTPAVAVVATWFHRKRALAMGIVSAGSSLGGLSLPILITKLLPKIGFGWTVRIMGFIMFTFYITALVTMKSRLPSRHSGPILDFSAFRNGSYNFYVAGIFFTFLATYSPFYYIEQYAIKQGISPNVAFYLLSVINAMSTVGRVMPNYFADRIGAINMIIPAMFMTAVVLFIWPATYSPTSLILFAVAYGFSSGAVVSLPPAVLASLSTDMSKIGTLLGMAFLITAFASLIGAPLTGAIISAQGGSYFGAAMFSGGCLVLAAICVIFARLKFVGWKFWVIV